MKRAPLTIGQRCLLVAALTIGFSFTSALAAYYLGAGATTFRLVIATATSLLLGSASAYLAWQLLGRVAEQSRRLANALQQQTGTDQLTGLFNRQQYFQQALHKTNQLIREDGTAVVMLLDIDNFKKINDTYGHEFGDSVLIEVATAIRGAIRNYDLLARLGGEEFAIFCPNLNIKHATQLANRILESIRQSMPRYNNKPILITASIGVVESSLAGADHDLARADGALCAAKKGGRNRVIHH